MLIFCIDLCVYTLYVDIFILYQVEQSGNEETKKSETDKTEDSGEKVSKWIIFISGEFALF